MDREKALDMALKQIEKQYGAGALMKLGEDQQVQVPAIPTGALSLDLALGVGGLPRGRVVELFGPEASGKCHPAGTWIWTDRGLETIEELFTRCGEGIDTDPRITDVSEQAVRLVNEDGELEAMAAVTHNGVQQTWRIVLESGRSVTATANHPLCVLNERGQVVWRKVEELRDGDVVVSALFGADAATGGVEHLSEDEALLLGYLVAEGTVGEKSRHRFGYCNVQDPDTLDEYLRLVEDVLGIPRKRVKTYDDANYWFNDTAARKVLYDKYGLDYLNAPEKTVPYPVRTGGPKAQRAFLSALFEGDGWIEDGPEICLTTASEVLAEQVQLLLYGLGIPASLTQKWNSEYERHYHTVRIPPGGTARFLAEIGFRSARRADQVANHLRDGTWPNTKWEAVPGIADLVRDLRDVIGGDREIDRLYHDLSRSDLTVRDGGIDASRTRLEAIVTWAESKHVPPAAEPLLEQLRAFAEQPYTYERIVAIEDAGEQPTFDVVVPRTHSFVANGILSHNTTVALHVIAEAQKLGGIAAFIDAEHALDPVYARAIGVDVDELLVSQPDTGEQALEITDMLVRSGAVDIIAIDSVAALVPRAEIEGEMGDTHVGLQARLMSQAMRKLSGSISKSKTTVVFINQLREKIGVMFGCMSYSTRVTLADGTQEKIGKIVNQKMDVEVLSYDRERGEIVPKRVTDWFDNGPTDEFLRFTVARGGGNGRSQFACTANHQIMTPSGWREAQELDVGDRVVQSVPHHLSDFQWEVLLGGLMGDSALSPTRSGHGARLRWGHGERQADYGDWKASLFSNLNVSRTTNDKGAVFHDVQPLPELADLREAVYWEGSKVLSHDYLKRLAPLSLAIWYMDDGSFRLRAKGLQERTKDGSGRSQICVQALEPTSRTRLAEYLRDTWDLDVTLSVRGKRQIPYLVFNKDATARFHALIAPFVHPSMQYKLLPKYRGRFDVEPVFAPMRYEPVPMPVVKIEAKPPNGRATHRFDIEVEGTHNYFVDGVMVHNSPETTPGGRALKFYSSVRLDVRRIESLKDGSDFVGSRVRVKVVKNKVSSPFRQAEFDILFGEGISKEGAILDVGLDAGIVNKAGAWYQYGDDNLGQGRENARVFLKENDDIAREIEKKAKEALGLIPTNTAEGEDPEAEDADESDADDES